METLERVAQLLTLATVPLLALAVVLQVLRRRGEGRHTPPFPALAAMALVAVVAAVGILQGRSAGIPFGFGVSTVAAFLLVCVLLRSDARFWLALVLLVVAYTVVGWISVTGLAHNYDAASGGWRGVRLLVAWGGPAANPEAPDFDAARMNLSIMRYGLPLATTVAVAWVLATRTVMTRIERLALLLVSSAFLAEVVVGATLSAITFAVGLVGGLPWGIGVAGVIASLFMLFTVGPGAVVGILVGARALVAGAHAAGNAASLVTTVRGAGSGGSGPGLGEPAGPFLASLAGFLRGNVGWVQKLNVIVIVGVFGLVGLSTLAFRVVSHDSGRVEVTYQYVDDEISLPSRVVRSLDAGGGRIWLVSEDTRLRQFDPATRSLTAATVPVQDAVRIGKTVVAVTAGARPRLVRLQGLSTVHEIARLAPGEGISVAATRSRAYVVDGSGRMLAVDSNGRILARGRAAHAFAVAIHGTQVWTLHRRPDPAAPEGFAYRAVRHDARTLATRGTQRVRASGTDLVFAKGWLYRPSAHAFARDKGAAPGRWTAGRVGQLTLVDGGRTTRYDFHYDTVKAVFEGATGSWLVTRDDPGIALTPRATPTSYLVHWPGAPSRAAA